ncbi:6143_t:CDS:2, partial [Racocetra persica]
LKEYKKQRELKTKSQSQDELKAQMQFSPENPYVSEIVLESTDKSSTETQEILQPNFSKVNIFWAFVAILIME